MSRLTIKSVAIIGRGKVGQSLTQLLGSLDYKVDNIGRDRSKQITAVANADITLICVDDGSIQGACEALAASFKVGSVVGHCSGSLDSSILKSAQRRGCLVASCHPLNTFPSIDLSLRRFATTDHGSYMYSEGDAEALSILVDVFDHAGFTNTCIEREAKPLYHAACVFACNYLTSVMHMSLETASEAGLEKQSFWLSLQPLIQATLENIGAKGTEGALSGPIARGDHSTVESHMIALGQRSELLKASYADLGITALEIAIKKGDLSNGDVARLKLALHTSDIK
jgi:predicted short-subunit dehydrogenase-like oxidoreductase (DUF2520 family)